MWKSSCFFTLPSLRKSVPFRNVCCDWFEANITWPASRASAHLILSISCCISCRTSAASFSCCFFEAFTRSHSFKNLSRRTWPDDLAKTRNVFSSRSASTKDKARRSCTLRPKIFPHSCSFWLPPYAQKPVCCLFCIKCTQFELLLKKNIIFVCFALVFLLILFACPSPILRYVISGLLPLR